MTPVFPAASARTAAAPKRSEMSRSNVVGEPPRRRWPSTTCRVSWPVGLADLRRHPLPDPAEPLGRARLLLHHRVGAALRPRALRHDDHGEGAAPRVALLDLLGDAGEVVGDLRDEDHVGGAGDAGVERDPAGVAPHHLDHHHAPVRGRGRVQPVDALGGEGHRGVEAERRRPCARGRCRSSSARRRCARPSSRARWRSSASRRRRPPPPRRCRSRRGPSTSSSVRSTSATVPSGCFTGNLRGLPAFVVPMIVPPRWVMPRTRLPRERDEAAVRVLVGQEDAVVAVADADHLPAPLCAARTTARMTAFSPGASPPPVLRAMRRIPFRRDAFGFGMLRPPLLRCGEAVVRRRGSRFKPCLRAPRGRMQA